MPSCIVAASRLLVVFTALLGLAACQSTSRSAGHAGLAPQPGPISHVVFIKLKNPTDAAEMLADSDRDLGTLPMLLAYASGQHLDTGRGDRIDSGYDVGLYMTFASEDDYTAYVEHPRHTAAIEKWRPRWEWIRIYDFLDSTP